MNIFFKGGRGLCYLKRLSHLFRSNNNQSRTLFSFILGLICVLFSGAQAQSGRTLGGVVRSAADGQPITNASVSSDKLQARTDTEGKFAILVDKPNGTIIIKHIGFAEQSFAYDETTTILEIGLQPAENEIEEVEVVNTGYQRLKRSNATGSFVIIDSTLLQLNVSGSMTERLRFVSPSFLVESRGDNDQRIQIRGMYALREDVAKPLIILDNFPYEGDLDDINPAEIESVNILRDASAASIWGARAGNGVIVLNSKKVKRPGLKTTVDANTTLMARPNLMNNRQILSTAYFLGFEQYMFSLGHGLADTADFRRPALSPLYELLLDQKRGKVTDQDVQAQVSKWGLGDIRQGYMDHVYRTAQNVRTNFSLHYGGEKSMTIFTAGYEKGLENIRDNDSRRLSFMLNNTIRPNASLEINFGVRLMDAQNRINGLGSYGSLNVNGKRLSPYLTFLDDTGNPADWDIYYRKIFTDTAGQGLLHDWKFSPLRESGSTDRTSNQRNIIADVGLKYKIADFITSAVSYRGSLMTNNRHFYYDEETYLVRDLVNRFTRIQNGSPIYQIPNEGILDKGDQRNYVHHFRTQITGNKNWAAHGLDVLLGGEISMSRTLNSENRVYGFNEKWNHTAINYQTLYPTFANLAGSQYIPYLESYRAGNDRNVSLYTNINYSLYNRYTVSFSARRDASNLFGVETNQKWNPLWSAGALWKAHEEPFFNLPFSQFDVRVTYGKSGNINKSVSAFPTIRYSASSLQITQIPSTSIMGGYNPNFKWEEIGTLNASISFSTKDKRLRGNLEFYEKKARDVIAFEPTDPTTGYTSNPKNSAHIDGSGIDASLDFDVLRLGKLNWNVLAQYSLAKYTVAKYLGAGLETYIGFVSDGSVLSILEGYHPYAITSFKWAGLDPETGNPQGYVEGAVSSDYGRLVLSPVLDQSYNGTAVPQSFGNILNRFSFGDIRFSFNVSYRLGHKFRKNSIFYERMFSNNDIHADVLRRWQKAGDEQTTDVPSLQYPINTRRDQFYLNSDATVLDGSSIRLNDMQMSYQINMNKLIRRGLQPVDLFCNLNQINWVWWKSNKEGVDPDFKDGFRPSIQWSFGIKTNF
ncbi:hypothetical protein FAZ15_04505 [Sphingobacterium olei]|uniref:TonB-dependent receptor plug domain-containing protein n=1 Tax=Sphingobacterium olei TaxID=2571155 RepID=A0A4U0P3E4_9SPHI|nr:TonB-dependent receptor plug domain-containing protein [Sphingobacterium olei]TJZ61783.1 hypothetical protein FAZ15_04505 [Sphingobacterium olei]